jgi:hypothetical protein
MYDIYRQLNDNKNMNSINLELEKHQYKKYPPNKGNSKCYFKIARYGSSGGSQPLQEEMLLTAF